MACMVQNSKWLEWLKEQGILREEDQVYQIVISIRWDEPVRIYVSRYADDLKVIPPDVNDTSIEAVEVVRVGENENA